MHCHSRPASFRYTPTARIASTEDGAAQRPACISSRAPSRTPRSTTSTAIPASSGPYRVRRGTLHSWVRSVSKTSSIMRRSTPNRARTPAARAASQCPHSCSAMVSMDNGTSSTALSPMSPNRNASRAGVGHSSGVVAEYASAQQGEQGVTGPRETPEQGTDQILAHPPQPEPALDGGSADGVARLTGAVVDEPQIVQRRHKCRHIDGLARRLLRLGRNLLDRGAALKRGDHHTADRRNRHERAGLRVSNENLVAFGYDAQGPEPHGPRHRGGHDRPAGSTTDLRARAHAGHAGSRENGCHVSTSPVRRSSTTCAPAARGGSNPVR
jgi:hypothetical protein